MIGSNADLSEYLKRVSKLSIDGRIKWSTGSGMSFYWDKPESDDLVSRVSIQRSESSIGDEYLFTVTRRPRTSRGALFHVQISSKNDVRISSDERPYLKADLISVYNAAREAVDKGMASILDDLLSDI